ALSHFATTIVATAFPIKFVGVKPSDIKRWTPRMSATLSTGTLPTEASVAARTTNAAPATPAAPFDASSRTSNNPICCWIESGGLDDCARKTAAVGRYMHG